MRLTPRLTLAAALGAAALAAVAWTGTAASRQTTCNASDTPCRLTQIEASLARIERALDIGGTTGGGGAAPGVSGGVSVASDQRCYAGYDCQQTASSVCATSGFSRGVPAQIEDRNGTKHLVRATCLDAGGAGPGGVDVASDQRCHAGYDCQQTATSVCGASGFSRGVPAQIQDRSGTKHLTRATCLD